MFWCVVVVASQEKVEERVMEPKEIVAYDNATLTNRVFELTAKLDALLKYLGAGMPVRFRMIPKDTWVVEDDPDDIDVPPRRCGGR